MRKQFLLFVATGVFVLGSAYIFVRPNKSKSAHDSIEMQEAAPAQPAQDTAATINAKQDAEYTKNKQLADAYTKDIAAGNFKDGDTYYQRGLVYLKMHLVRAAITDFSAALKMVPDSANALYSRALAYQQNQQFDLAITDLNEAIKYKPDFADAYNLRGLIYVEQNNLRDAQTDYDAAIKINPNFDLAYFNLGTLYVRQKQYPQAKEAFLMAIKVNQPTELSTQEDQLAAKSRLAVTYLNLANVEFASNDLDNALKTLNYLIENDPTNVDAYKLRAEIYDKQGNTAAAANDHATADNLSLQNMLNNK